MKFTKGDIDRLGDAIRQEKYSLSEGTLSRLQEYRISHQQSLSTIFSILCSYIKKLNSKTIVTYRIKRFESIIGKLSRYPDMRFSRMWDIGGCRIIVQDDREVYKMKALLESNSQVSIVKEYDYIMDPQKDGYKSLHLFLKCTEDTKDKVIEVQIRSLRDHNWATLVEITDVLYGFKIKELADNKDLSRFHFLLSKTSELNTAERKEIAKIIYKYEYFEKLSEVFSRNYIKVRQQWNTIENQQKHKYFLIQANKDEIPVILPFQYTSEAESKYLNVYKSAQNANVVLTHLPNATYNQISIAYSNYILTFHSFLEECYDIIECLIVEAVKNGEYFYYAKILHLYNALIFGHIENLTTEIAELNEDLKKNGNKKKNGKKEKEWIKDIQSQVNSSRSRNAQFSKQFLNSIPSSRLSKFLVNSIRTLINSKYKFKLLLLFKHR